MINFLGATPVPMPLVESRGFSFDLDTFEQKLSPRTKMVVLNSPANPTGGVIPREDLAKIADLLRDRDVLILSDEIYSRICYGVEPASITQFAGMLEKTIILDGFSKTYSMTGWRLGYGVMPLWLVDAVDKLMVNSNSCTASFTQRAGLAALQGPQDASTRWWPSSGGAATRSSKGLNEIPGFRCIVPDGAFYAFPNVNGTGVPSKRARRHAAQRRRRRLPERHRVRQLRRRLSAIQLRRRRWRTSRTRSIGSGMSGRRTVGERVRDVTRASTGTSIAPTWSAASASAARRLPSARRLLSTPHRWRHQHVSSMRTCSCCSGRSMIGSMASTMPSANGRFQSPTSCTDSPT